MVTIGLDTAMAQRMTLSLDLGQHYQRMPVVRDDLNALMTPGFGHGSSFTGGIMIEKHSKKSVQQIGAGYALVTLDVYVPNDNFYGADGAQKQYAYFNYRLGLHDNIGSSRWYYQLTGGPLVFVSAESDRSAWTYRPFQADGHNQSQVAVITDEPAESPSVQLAGQIQAAITYPIHHRLNVSLWTTGMVWARRTYRIRDMSIIVNDTTFGKASVESYMPIWS